MSGRSGCSPYDLARLCDEYPFVFDEYAAMFEAPSKPRMARRAATRKQRVSRIFGGR